MGILNVTPDSFYDGGQHPVLLDQLRHVEVMIRDGAAIIDIGAVSTRPGAAEVSIAEEAARLMPVLTAVRKAFPSQYLSVDTFRAEIAKMAIDEGAQMINDIYGGRYDEAMFPLIAKSGVDYVMMHMQGTPNTMQVDPHYEDVTDEVMTFFLAQLTAFPETRSTIYLDPGFGFGKTSEHNFRLLNDLDKIKTLGCPVVAGLSRKSMISKVIGIKPEQALNGTTVLNTIALLNGADILRVHDVKEAVQTIRLVAALGNT
jgi:dihydropteroate synthase